MQNDNEVMETQTDTDYIAAINDLKANSVPKEQYNKLKAENKQLLDTLVSGGQIAPEEKPESIDDLRKDLFGGKELTNLEYCQKTLQLREQILEKENKDIFLPNGHDYRINDADVAAANKVAEVMQECIDYADGDNEIFTTELMRRTKETPVPKRKK